MLSKKDRKWLKTFQRGWKKRWNRYWRCQRQICIGCFKDIKMSSAWVNSQHKWNKNRSVPLLLPWTLNLLSESWQAFVNPCKGCSHLAHWRRAQYLYTFFKASLSGCHKFYFCLTGKPESGLMVSAFTCVFVVFCAFPYLLFTVINTKKPKPNALYFICNKFHRDVVKTNFFSTSTKVCNVYTVSNSLLKSSTGGSSFARV